MIALHQRHGKLVRTGPNEVSVSDLAAIKKIYGASSDECVTCGTSHNSNTLQARVQSSRRAIGIVCGKDIANSISSLSGTSGSMEPNGDLSVGFIPWTP